MLRWMPRLSFRRRQRQQRRAWWLAPARATKQHLEGVSSTRQTQKESIGRCPNSSRRKETRVDHQLVPLCSLTTGPFTSRMYVWMDNNVPAGYLRETQRMSSG